MCSVVLQAPSAYKFELSRSQDALYNVYNWDFMLTCAMTDREATSLLSDLVSESVYTHDRDESIRDFQEGEDKQYMEMYTIFCEEQRKEAECLDDATFVSGDLLWERESPVSTYQDTEDDDDDIVLDCVMRGDDLVENVVPQAAADNFWDRHVREDFSDHPSDATTCASDTDLG